MSMVDIAVVVAYLGLMAGTGFYFMRRNKDADAYFKAGGRLPWWVVSLSIYATMFSSITFISVPATSFAGDMSYFVISSANLNSASSAITTDFYERLRLKADVDERSRENRICSCSVSWKWSRASSWRRSPA